MSASFNIPPLSTRGGFLPKVLRLLLRVSIRQTQTDRKNCLFLPTWNSFSWCRCLWPVSWTFLFRFMDAINECIRLNFKFLSSGVKRGRKGHFFQAVPHVWNFSKIFQFFQVPFYHFLSDSLHSSLRVEESNVWFPAQTNLLSWMFIYTYLQYCSPLAPSLYKSYF